MWDAERTKFVRQMELLKLAGAPMFSAVHNGAVEHNHFSKHPPDRCPGNAHDRQFQRVARRGGARRHHHGVREPYGLPLSEIAWVVEGVNSSWQRVNFDFANSLSVIEDPVDAVKTVAKWTVMTHLKDIRCPAKDARGRAKDHDRHAGRWLGRRRRDLADPAGRDSRPREHLPHCLEIAPLPDQDPELWVRKSIRYVDRHYAHLFNDVGKRARLAERI